MRWPREVVSAVVVDDVVQCQALDIATLNHVATPDEVGETEVDTHAIDVCEGCEVGCVLRANRHVVQAQAQIQEVVARARP